ncbi:MAG: DNA-binding protein [Thermoplasmata archaeon]|nr:MAG: DNA-binding protein [Thermoplasmata archaeon]
MVSDKELEEIRKRKLMQLKAMIEQKKIQEEQERIVEEQIRDIMRKVMTPEARERLARIRLVRPEVAALVEQQILMLVQTGRLKRVIDDNTLKLLLDKIASEKREIRIRRK